MTIDERLEALAQSVELLTHDIHELQTTTKLLQATGRDIQAAATLLLETARQDGENIRALARIADIHERRITKLEGPETGG